MKNKGFTLVELLAVIVLLGLVLVITMTNGFGLFNKAKGGINQIEEDNLIEAAKVFLVDVDNDFVSAWPTGCSSKSDFTAISGCNVKVSYIIENYMDKIPQSCDDSKILTLKIVEDSTTGIVDYVVEKQISGGVEEIICSK